jgi:hypothetical protein
MELAYKPCKREPVEPVESMELVEPVKPVKPVKWSLNYRAGQSFGVPAQTHSRDSVSFLRKIAKM